MMRRQLATAILTSNPPEHALRPFLLAVLVVVAACASAASSTAHACAMYIPPEVERQLVAEAPTPDADAGPSVADAVAAAQPSLSDIFAVIDGPAPAADEAAADEAVADEAVADEAVADDAAADDAVADDAAADDAASDDAAADTPPTAAPAAAWADALRPAPSAVMPTPVTLLPQS